MLEYREIPDTNVVEFVVDGRITAEEFDGVIAQLETAIERHGKIRVLEQIRSFGGMPVSKWWDDIKFGLRHVKDIERAAVVADKKWIEVFAAMVNPFVSAEVRYFDPANLDEARLWLREPKTATAGSPGAR